MKYIVISEFVDKYTSELHKVGETIDITKKRADEILSVGNLIKRKPKNKE